MLPVGKMGASNTKDLIANLSFQNFRQNIKKQNATEVWNHRLILTFMNRDKICIFPFLRKGPKLYGQFE